MVVYYKVAGQSIGSHWVCGRSPILIPPPLGNPDARKTQLLTVPNGQLSIATLSTLFVGSWAAMGGKKADAQKGPPINASSKDEEDFVQYVYNLPPEERKMRPEDA